MPRCGMDGCASACFAVYETGIGVGSRVMGQRGGHIAARWRGFKMVGARVWWWGAH